MAHFCLQLFLQPEISLFRMLLFFSRSRDLRWLITAHNLAGVAISATFFGRLQGVELWQTGIDAIARELHGVGSAGAAAAVLCSGNSTTGRP